MKKNLIITLFFLLVFASCNTLDKFPMSQMSPEEFFKNEAEMQAFSNTFYTAFPAEGLYNEQADNVIGTSLSDEVRGTRIVPTSGGGWSWTALRDINTLLDYQENCTDINVRQRYVAVARFFRAYFYFEKVKRFGDVPWIDTQLDTDSPELTKPRDSREFVMQKMLDDIDYAIEYLPTSRSLYTITRWTALALKSRICLFEGTYRKYHNINQYEKKANDYLQLCVDASDRFISQSGYGLYTTGGANACYRNLFVNADQAGTEVILARDYSTDQKVFHNSHWYLLSTSMGRPGVTKRIINSYLMKDGTRFTDKSGYQTMTFVQETSNRDPRMGQSIRIPGYTRVGQSQKLAPDLSLCCTGYQPTKYLGKTDGDGSANKSYTDLIIFRSAEVYLNYAEAKAELGTLTQADLDKSVNKLRSRVGMPAMNMAAANSSPDPYLLSTAGGYPNVKGSNQGVILEIRRERSIELLMEGFRYYDMIRWKEGKSFEQPLYGIYFSGLGDHDLDGDSKPDVHLYVGSYPNVINAPYALKVNVDCYLSGGEKGYLQPGKNVSCVWNENRDYLYPIPTDERSLNKNLTQNPGWNDGLDF